MNVVKLLQNRIVKNATWLVAGKAGQALINIAVVSLTARFLGPANSGIIEYASSYTAFFMAICTLGINSIIVKEFIDNPEREGEIIGTSLLLRAISSFLSAAIIVIIVTFVDADEPTTILVTALCSIGLIFNVFDTFAYWFQVKLNSKVTAVTLLIAYALTSLYKLMLIFTRQPVAWFALATSIDYALVGAIFMLAYKKYNGKPLRVSAGCAARLLKKSYHFILPSIMVAVYGYTDKIMLKQMIGDVETGYYSAAVRICTMWCFVLAAIIDSVFPSIMESHSVSRDEFERKNKQLYAIVFYMSMGVSAVLTIIAPFIIHILYGEQFSAAVSPLRVITWYTAFSYMGVARNAWIVCENRQNYLKYIYLIAAVTNIVLNLVFIPPLKATGAAVASLITQIVTILVPFLFKKTRRNTELIFEAVTGKGLWRKKK